MGPLVVFLLFFRLMAALGGRNSLAMTWSEDAPALEMTLHKHFALDRVNKVNHRKEFFRASLTDIHKQIESMEIESHWTMAAEAQQFRETLAIERAIEKDEAAKEAWLNRQLVVKEIGFDTMAEYREQALTTDQDRT
jgi:Meiotically Up-regulated Gene 113 (MUG113) protein